MIRAFSILLALVSAPGLTLCAQAPDRWQPVRDSIQAQLLRVGGAAMSVAVAKDGKILWEQGFGWANREKRIPASEHTMFSLASISKPITATGLMVLVGRGKIDLDKPANEYLGAGKITGLAGPASEATVRRILNHTAGLPTHYQFFYANEDRRPASMDETIARYGNLVSAPGETYRYSNLGFGIIDYLISRVSGQTYADFMRQEVFLPLGLTHTSIDIGPGLEAFAAERYDRRGNPIPFYTFDHNGGSAVYSSAHDLVRFGMFHLKNRLPGQRAILSDSLIGVMTASTAPRAFGNPNINYGLGWSVDASRRGHRFVAHSGGMPGVATTLHLYPDQNVSLVVLTNGGGNPAAISDLIASVVIPRYADSLRAERARPEPAPAPVPFVAPAELIGRWDGTLRTWQRTVPLRLLVESDGDIKIQIGTLTPGTQLSQVNQLETLLNGATWQHGALRGMFAGTIPTADASWTPHAVSIELRLVDGKLRGPLNAESGVDPLFFSIASYAELSKR